MTAEPAPPLLELRDVGKDYGSVIALDGITTTVRAGEVTCVLGDNGAGKSTLIKILVGRAPARPRRGAARRRSRSSFGAPREALDAGIATVYQDLAMIPLMAIWRNFFLGAEPTRGRGPFRRFDAAQARDATRRELAAMGIDIRDPDQPVGTLSGGERQSVAIARAVHFGARVLILDEPTSALGVKQAGVVLRYVAQARDRGRRRRPHHPQPAPRLSGGRPLPGAQPRPQPRQLRQERGQPRRADPADGRRCGARPARARAGAPRVLTTSSADGSGRIVQGPRRDCRLVSA